MEIIGKLKEDVEKAETKEEAKKVIEEAGMKLTDEEMDQVAGGKRLRSMLAQKSPNKSSKCPGRLC